MAKVGTLNEEQVEEVKKGRQDFDVEAYGATNEGAVDADGLMAIAPGDYSYRKHNTLKKDVFTTEAIFMRHQANVAAERAEFYATRSAELVGKADRLEKFGSETARKQAGKLERAKKQMDTIRQQLIDGGMAPEEIDSLIANM